MFYGSSNYDATDIIYVSAFDVIYPYISILSSFNFYFFIECKITAFYNPRSSIKVYPPTMMSLFI